MPESKLKFEIRTKFGMTITEFCETYDVSRGTVSQWINKKRPISPRYIRLLAGLGFTGRCITKPWEKV